MARIIDTALLSPEGYPDADGRIRSLSENHNDWVYNGLDCAVTLEIRNTLLQQLDPITRKTYNFSLALQGPIFEMSLRGLLVDKARRAEVLAKYRNQLMQIGTQLDAIINDGIGLSLNWRSNAQLKKLFYDVMSLPPVRKRDANGAMSPTVNREALEKLTQYMMAEPLCNRILLLRDIDKKRSFLETELDADSRMRSNYNIAGTNTGRLSSAVSDFGTGTNSQNVDRDLRSVFVADKGMKLGNLDLEQADARNVGAINWNLFVGSHGEDFAGAYLNACESGDLHTTVCRMAWHDLNWADDAKANKVVAEAIAYRNDSYRQLAKKLGHGTNYYGTPPTMARHTKVDRKIIEEFQARYFRGFPAIPAWHEWVKSELKSTHQLTTLMGRRRSFFGRAEEASTLREAIAFAPQSMTADEVDTGLLRLFRANRVQLLAQVHDSILIQYPEEQEDEIIPWAIDLMKVTIPLTKGREFHVPVDAKVGWNWGDTTFEKDGKTVKENPDGLMKYKGHDPRKRTEKVPLDIRSLL